MTGKPKAQALSPRQVLSDQRVLRISGPVMKKIATWNAQSMFQAGKIHNAIKEMKRMNIEILGISEMRWPNSGECLIDDHYIYYAGNDEVNHYNGVAFIVNAQVQKTVKSFVPVSDRVAFLQFNSRPYNVNIIQVYAPTSDHSDEVVEAFYEQLQTALNLTKKSEVTIIMGDFNAKIGSGAREDIVGRYGLGVANERGDRLFQFCQEMGFVVSNTFFKLPPRRLYTWTSNAHTPERIVRNQIDFVLINKR